jgi:hypothetical protein
MKLLLILAVLEAVAKAIVRSLISKPYHITLNLLLFFIFLVIQFKKGGSFQEPIE